MDWLSAGQTVGGTVLDLLGGSQDARNEAEANYASDQNSANQAYANAINTEGAYTANVGNQWETAQWQADNATALNQGVVQQSMFDTKYGVAQNQANFDALQAEFGDMADNVANHFRTLSPSSIQAQNNEMFNKAYATEMEGLNQRLTEQGVNPGSGMAQALRGMAGMQTATGKVMANRNVGTEVAQAQGQFLNSAAQNPLYNARPLDFNEGILDQNQLDTFAPTNENRINDLTPQGYDVVKAETVKADTESGFLGGLFG